MINHAPTADALVFRARRSVINHTYDMIGIHVEAERDKSRPYGTRHFLRRRKESLQRKTS